MNLTRTTQLSDISLHIKQYSLTRIIIFHIMNTYTGEYTLPLIVLIITHTGNVHNSFIIVSEHVRLGGLFDNARVL